MLCGSCCAGSPEFLAFCWFWHVLACFSTFWCCQCNFCCLLLIFISRQFLTYVWFFLLLPNLSFAFFFLTTRLRTFVARLLSSQEDFFPRALPCMQRFRAFFMPLLLVSYLFASTQRKEAQCARQTKTNQLVATHGGVTHKHAPCQSPFNKDLWKWGHDSM